MCDACEMMVLCKSRMLIAKWKKGDVDDKFLSCCIDGAVMSELLAWMGAIVTIFSQHTGMDQCDFWIYDHVYLPVNARLYNEGCEWWIEARAIKLERCVFLEAVSVILMNEGYWKVMLVFM